MTPSVREIDEETIAAYQADGVVVLRGVFADWVEPLREGIAALMAVRGIRGAGVQVNTAVNRSLSSRCT